MKRAGIASLLLVVIVTSCMTSGPRQTKLMKSTEMTISAEFSPVNAPLGS